VRSTREHATSAGNTDMITSATWGRRPLFQSKRGRKLLVDTRSRYRGLAYSRHLVVMPGHIHVLLTPTTSREKAVRFIRGGFSYRAKAELSSNMEVWQKGVWDHRIRETGDYLHHVSYIRENPVGKYLCERDGEFPYSSAPVGFELDQVPQGLAPSLLSEADTARLEGLPVQSKIPSHAAEIEPFPAKKKTP